jgi:hypothetical protein
MYEVQDALATQKARFSKDEEQFKKREEELRAKDLNLQHQLFRFNKFLQDNEAKRRRAETRAAEETAQIRQKEEEIKDLEKQLAESNQQLTDLDQEVTRNMKYEEFLERVKDSCEDYQEIQDLVTRHDTLESANRDLMELATASENRIEEIGTEFRSYRKQQEMEMLAFTNKIASLSQDLDDMVTNRQQYEHQADIATQEDSMHSLYFGQIVMSVENLFLRCTAKRTNIRHDDEFSKNREGEEQDVDEDSFRSKQQTAIRQLKVILAYLKDFKDMTEELRKMRKRQQEAEKAQKGQQNVESERAAEPKISVETEAPRPGDRGSGGQKSDSQGTSKEVSMQFGGNTG